MYAKIIDEQTKQVEVGTGTNTAFYQKIGMQEMEVEQAWNGAWYVKGYAPAKPQELIIAEQKAVFIAQLDALDLKCIRALRALEAGTGTDADSAKLADLEAQAAQIRQELQELGE